MALPNQNLNEIIERQEERVGGLLKETYKLGFMQGFRDGYSSGVKDTAEHLKSAVSEGLRLGSARCGSAMNFYKRK